MKMSPREILKRLLITAVLILSPFVVYYAGMFGVYSADYLIHYVETGKPLPMNIRPPSPYPWYYISLSLGTLLGIVWIAVGVKKLKQIK